MTKKINPSSGKTTGKVNPASQKPVNHSRGSSHSNPAPTRTTPTYGPTTKK